MVVLLSMYVVYSAGKEVRVSGFCFVFCFVLFFFVCSSVLVVMHTLHSLFVG